jgi:septum formation protein
VLVLASQSPRRQEILRNAGIDFTVRSANVEEIRGETETPAEYVRRLARAKAQAVTAGDSEIVLGADTVVLVRGQVLEKPRDAADAEAMLRALSGRDHQVLTGICLRTARRTVEDSAVTRVHFRALDDREIAEYIASGEPMDKAGAYAIQGLASKFIDRIEGCYFNVVGLPVALVHKHLKELSKERSA